MSEEYIKIKLPKNPLALLTIILGILLIVSVIFMLSGSSFNMIALSPNQAGLKAVSFLDSQTNSSIQLENVTEISGIYQIYVVYQNQSLPIYSTKDGKYLLQGAIPVY
jgi:Disulfide bond isomerase protein N-terminus